MTYDSGYKSLSQKEVSNIVAKGTRTAISMLLDLEEIRNRQIEKRVFLSMIY